MILSWWQNQPAPAANLNLLTEVLNEGHLVDDTAPMEIATAVVAARLPDNSYVRGHVTQIMIGVTSSSIWSVYAQIWIASKYCSDQELMEIVEFKVSQWSTHEQLSRLIAGLFPRFANSLLLSKFRSIVRRSGALGALSVLQFHEDLSTTIDGYTSVAKFIRALNPSLPNRISHSKFLMLISLLQNPAIAPIAATELKGRHSVALSDQFYKSLTGV